MNYQWYPGHMTKAKRQMQEDLKLIDLIIELVDARVPVSSRNPDIDAMGRNKARLILLNKADLADERCNQKWMDYFKEKGFYAVKVNSRSGAGLKGIQAVVQEACREKIERGQKTRDHEPAGTGDGGRYPERGKIHIYQFLCGKSVYENRKPTGCDKGKTVDPSEQKSGTPGYSGNPVAEIRGSAGGPAPCNDRLHQRRDSEH